MGEIRKGRQTPTQSVVLPYSSTYGAEAIDIYNSTGRTAQEWQELLLSDILAVNEEGLWVHTKFGYSVPRRNGKNEIVAIREMYGLKKGERILHTAHRTTTTHSAWERLSNLLKKANIEVVSSYKAFGKEHLEVAGGGIIEFRTRTSKGGLGEGFDLLIIDEAQEYQDDQESALKYVVTDSKNPQTMTKLEGNIDLGDIVGGKDYLTGISMKKPIGRKIWTISSGKEKVVYKLEGET